MFGNKKQKEKRKLEKELKNYGKYGEMQIKHSHMGICSCGYAAGSALALCVAIIIAYIKHGESAGFIGGIGILSIALAIYGIRAAVQGFKERDRKYITCKVGIGFNVLILLFLIVIFVGGIR